MGTLDYCAPEQIRGEQVDARTDEYALACAAFMLLSGEPPFHRDEGMAVLYAQLSAPPPRLTSRRSDLPSAVDEVLLRALAKAPGDRYPSCGEFADALRIACGLQRYTSDAANTRHQRALIDHADPLARHANSASYCEPGHSDEAIELYQRTLIDQQHALGADHPDTLATRISIAREMAAGGDHSGAEQEFREVFAARLRTLGPDHRDALIARFGIAQQMAARGDHSGAEQEFREVVVGRQRILGPDHRDTLIARFSIAQQMAAREDHAGAEQEFRAILPHLRRKLGPDHPDTLATRFSIAREMAARGDHARAQMEFRDVLPQLQQKLGRDHPVTLIARFSIAQQMAARGDHAGAEQEFRAILPHLRRKLGPDHPDTLAAVEWIEASAKGEYLDL